jgi:hypothetical protein
MYDNISFKIIHSYNDAILVIKKNAKNLNVDITSYYVKEMKQTPILSNLYLSFSIVIS